MEGRKRNPLKQHSSPQFKKKGGPKRGRQNNHTPEGASENANASDTVYRILCASRRIGSVIGKGGTIIKALREESQAKITVEDSVPGSDERVVIISSPPKPGKNRSTDDEENPTSGEGNVSMRPHCAAQDALMKIQEKIIEEDLAWAADEGGDEIEVTTRLLVPNNLVGCILGRKGDVITRLRTEIGADILVLPPESLPACAMDTDELVQVSGEPGLVKRAIYEISTLLHQNPRKGTPPTSYPAARSVQALRYSDFPPGRMIEQGNSFWPGHDHYLNGIPRPTHIGAYENQPSRYRVESFDGLPPSGGGEIPAEFTMKILCLDSKIGGVIGKGGGNVRHLQQETGANIHVEDLSADSDERVIRVSSVEALLDPRSQTIEAILQLQSLTSASSDKGIITTRLLVPSTKVGCIIGQGGQIINDMRRRTKADIRVISKEEKPKCASKDEELVQISGTVGFAHEALSEIASRLRTRFLSKSKGEPAPSRPAPAFGPGVEFPGPRPPPGALDRFHYFEGDVRDYGHPAYPGAPPNVRRFPNTTSPTELKIPTSTMSSAIGTGRGNISELAAPRMIHSEPWLGGHEHGAEMHRPMEHHWSPAPAARDTYQGFVSSSGQPSHAPQAVSYQTFNNVQQGTTHTRYSPSQMHYHQSVNPYEAAPYQSNHPQQVVAYPNVLPQGSSGFDLR